MKEDKAEELKNLGKFLNSFFDQLLDIGSEDKTKPPGERPKAPDMPEPKERRSTDLDPAKKFQCEMAERIFIEIHNKVEKYSELREAVEISNSVSGQIYKHFFS